jgi:hypothetical protein
MMRMKGKKKTKPSEGQHKVAEPRKVEEWSFMKVIIVDIRIGLETQ